MSDVLKFMWKREGLSPAMLHNLQEIERVVSEQADNNEGYTENTETVSDGLADHLADVSNPHDRLNSVTNDAQLKRAAGDINTFTEKTSPVSADIILIEDSAASYAKKKVQITNLPTGGGTTFDTDFYGTMSGNTTLSNTTWKKIGFDTATRDANSEFNAATDKWVCVDSGTYHISVILCFDGSSTGTRGLFFSINGLTSPAAASPLLAEIASTASTSRHNLSISYAFSTSDTLEIYGYQSSGGNLNALAAGSFFCVHRVQ